MVQAIYLFPTRTVGGQIVHSIIGLLGILSSLAYVNFVLFIANVIQSDTENYIRPPRRIFLLIAFGCAAFGCGYLRSKKLKSYLGINLLVFLLPPQELYLTVL